jgi:predicted FMN-binding regulatory protein PaiB
MYDSPRYQIDQATVDAFVAGQRHGTLLATATDGFPQASILPFIKSGDTIELHCVQADPTFAAVCANPRVSFLVSDFLAFSPHDWVDARDAGRATLHFRAVIFECEASVSTNPDAVAAALGRLIESYEPGAAGYEPLNDGSFYGPRLRMLAALRLRVLRSQAKFKLGPAAADQVKRQVVSGLRARDTEGDARAAAVIERSLTTERSDGTV